MKKITLTVLLLVSTLGMFAQGVEQQIYFTTFQAAPNSPIGWTKEMVSGDAFEMVSNWYYGETVLPTGGTFSAPAAVFNDDASFSDDPNTARIISRVFDLSLYDSVSMTFEYGLSYTQELASLNVEVFDGVEWVSVLIVDEDTAPILSNPIELNAYKNPLFQVRFTYSDGGSANPLGGAGVTNFKLMGAITVAPNDLIDHATVIYCGDNLASTNALSTPDSGLYTCEGINPSTSNGVWYKYLSTEQTGITLSLCNSAATDFDSRITVWKGSTEELECVAANDNSCGNLSTVSFDTNGYSMYYILVTGAAITTGNYTLGVTCGSLAPANDAIVNAIDVDQFEQPYTDFSVPLINATAEADQDFTGTGCEMGNYQLTVFYKFTATSNGTASVSIPNFSGLQLIMFYTAPNENATTLDLTLANQVGNECNVNGPEKSIVTTAGTTYYIVIFQEGLNSDINIDISSSLSTPTNTIEGFSYFPNPVTNALQLNSRANIENVTLYNVLGQNIKEYAPNALNASLDMDGIATGTYVMKALVDGVTGTYKIIKN